MILLHMKYLYHQRINYIIIVCAKCFYSTGGTFVSASLYHIAKFALSSAFQLRDTKLWCKEQAPAKILLLRSGSSPRVKHHSAWHIIWKQAIMKSSKK